VHQLRQQRRRAVHQPHAARRAIEPRLAPRWKDQNLLSRITAPRCSMLLSRRSAAARGFRGGREFPRAVFRFVAEVVAHSIFDLELILRIERAALGAERVAPQFEQRPLVGRAIGVGVALVLQLHAAELVNHFVLLLLDAEFLLRGDGGELLFFQRPIASRKLDLLLALEAGIAVPRRSRQPRHPRLLRLHHARGFLRELPAAVQVARPHAGGDRGAEHLHALPALGPLLRPQRGVVAVLVQAL
jgi:hypothetical protein